MWRKVFSSTTIDASTIMPTPRASPPKVMVFSVNPPKYSRANVPMTEIGIDVQMITVDRTFRRNKKMMATTSTAPMRTASRTAPIACSMNFEVSLSTDRRTPGTSRLIRSTSALTRRATATVFSPDCFVTFMRMPGLPLIRTRDRMSSVPS